jgi:hypothetical protein
VILNPLYHQLDGELEELKNIEDEQDLMALDRFGLQKYLVMMLSPEYKEYTKAIHTAMKKNEIKYQLKMKSVIIEDKQLIHQFLKTFTKELDNYFLYTTWNWYHIKDVFFEDKFLYFESQEDFSDKIYPKIKLDKLEIFPRLGFVFVKTEETSTPSRDLIKINSKQDSDEDTAIYIEDSKMVYQQLQNKLFGLIAPEYNMFEPFLKNINNPDDGMKQIREWISKKDFLPERMWGACGGHGQAELINKHPAIITEKIKKNPDWGTTNYCSYDKCSTGENTCCFTCEEFGECEDSCASTEAPFVFEAQETLKGTLKRAESYLNDNYLRKSLTQAEQHTLSENINYIKNSNLIEKIEKRKQQLKQKEEAEQSSEDENNEKNKEEKQEVNEK